MASSQPVSRDYSILSGFDKPIRRPRTSLLYQVGLFFVAFVMVLLPLIYVALVGLAAYGIYYHAVFHFKPIMGFAGSNYRVMLFKLFVYVTPLIVGVIILFFLIKPLFAGRPKRAQPLALNPQAEPLLFAFIERICRVVRAPLPRRIDLDCQLNAAAGFRRGFLSFLGNDLTLTLGLPLVANLTAREFAGVIAHEFGHFTQSVGMRLSYIIRSVNFWFARVVFERDAWDVALEEWEQEEQDWRVTLILGIARLGVMFSRLILHSLMLAGHAVSSFMLRQMEFNADAYEIRIAGSDAFERTTHKLASLEAVLNGAYKNLRVMWNNSTRLPDNLPEILRRNHETMPDHARERIASTLGLRRTGLFDTHPSAAERIRQAREAGDPGIFHDERPASMLFESFAHPAKYVTLLHYTDDLGLPVFPHMLVAVEPEAVQPAASEDSKISDGQTAADYFLGLLPLMAPLRVAELSAPIDPAAALEEAHRITSQLEQVTDQLAPVTAGFSQAQSARFKARVAERLLVAGVTISRPEDFGLTRATVDAARETAAEADARMQSLRRAAREVVAALNRRLHLALSVAAARVTDSDHPEEASRRLTDRIARLNKAAEVHPKWRQLEEVVEASEQTRTLVSSELNAPEFHQALNDLSEDTMRILSELSGEHAVPVPKPALRLQPSARWIGAGRDGLGESKERTRQWFAEYDSMLDGLARIAREVETGGG